MYTTEETKTAYRLLDEQRAAEQEIKNILAVLNALPTFSDASRKPVDQWKIQINDLLNANLEKWQLQYEIMCDCVESIEWEKMDYINEKQHQEWRLLFMSANQ